MMPHMPNLLLLLTNYLASICPFPLRNFYVESFLFRGPDDKPFMVVHRFRCFGDPFRFPFEVLMFPFCNSLSTVLVIFGIQGIPERRKKEQPNLAPLHVL